eukprot:symbB.v1.2.021164.t1/scaffold1815.1/size100239/9
MTYAELLKQIDEKRVPQMLEYEICTPKIAKEMLEEFSKLESEDASSEEAKKALEYKDKLKTASEAEEGEWCEAVNGGCMGIFDEIEKMEKKLKEGGEVRTRDISGMMEYVESKWTSEKLSKLSAAVLEKGKTIVEKAKKAENDKEQEKCLSEIKFSTGLAEGVIATYGMLGFTVPHFIISGTDTPCEQLEKKLKEDFPKGLEVDKDSELGKQIADAIKKLEGLMPEMQLICKENPREDPKAQADHKQTIVLKATLMSAAACAIKENTEDMSKMIEKAEASLKEDGEAVLFEGEEKQKILTKAQVDKALEVLKSKLKDLTEKAEKAKKEGEGEGKKEGEGEGGGLVRRAVVGPA